MNDPYDTFPLFFKVSDRTQIARLLFSDCHYETLA